MKKPLVMLVVVATVFISAMAFATNPKGKMEMSYCTFGPYEEMLVTDTEVGIAFGKDGKFQFYPYVGCIIISGVDFFPADLKLGTSLILGKYASINIETIISQQLSYKYAKANFKLEW